VETETSVEAGDGTDRDRVPVLIGRAEAGRNVVCIVGARLTIGRDPKADICIDATSVSRRHARISATGPDAFELRDLGSKNGTTVNGARVDSHALRSGDVVCIGPAELEFRFVTRAELERARRTAAAQARLRQLTDRELEVACLVASGGKNADIAKQLAITTRTVVAHLEHAFDRLAIRSRTELTRLVIEAGWADGAPPSARQR
jgi:pSer/pThr/pTyr-binding forkhead associated (FHA) protein